MRRSRRNCGLSSTSNREVIYAHSLADQRGTGPGGVPGLRAASGGSDPPRSRGAGPFVPAAHGLVAAEGGGFIAFFGERGRPRRLPGELGRDGQMDLAEHAPSPLAPEKLVRQGHLFRLQPGRLRPAGPGRFADRDLPGVILKTLDVTIVPTALGNICLKINLKSFAPKVLDAKIYSRFLNR